MVDAASLVSFADTRLLVLLAALPLAAWFLWVRERVRRRRADGFLSVRIRGERMPARFLRPWLLTVALAFGFLALAGPRLGYTLRPLLHDEGALIIAIDISNSMAAEDLGIARLTAAKAVVRQILEKERGKVGLVAYESVAEIIAPLTTDREAVADLAASLTTGELALPGSNPGAAVLTSLEALERSGSASKRIVLISDGEDQSDLLARAIESAREAGTPVSTVLVGSGEPSFIPFGRQRDPMRDEDGRVIRTTANPAVLSHLAEATGGIFLSNPFQPQAVSPLAGARRDVREDGEATQRVPSERYQWPLALSFLLFFAGSMIHRGAE
jgi:Ca-activated chloride channel homolog